MHRSTCLAAALAMSAVAARADPSPAQAATCVAALKARAEPYADRLRHGDTAVEAQLLPIVTASYAFIGSAFKQGIGKTEADALLKKAEQAQADMPAAEMHKLQERCQAQGQQLLADAHPLEREFVNRKAQARIDRWRSKAAS